MTGQVEPWVRDLGAYAIVIAAVIGAAFALGKIAPVASLAAGVWHMVGRGWRGAVSDPLAKFLRENVRDEVEQALNASNGGHTIRDRVERLEDGQRRVEDGQRRVEVQHEELRRGVQRIGDQVGVVGLFDPALPQREAEQ
jgi:hypothetical protein